MKICPLCTKSRATRLEHLDISGKCFKSLCSTKTMRVWHKGWSLLRRAANVLLVIVRATLLTKASKAGGTEVTPMELQRSRCACDAHPQQLLCTTAMAAMSVTESPSYVPENPQKRMLWRVLTSSALGVTLLSRGWLHSFCFWQHH